jgi:hypothetical protein
MSSHRAQTLSNESQTAVSSLAVSWRNAGRPSPTAASTSSGADCVMPACLAMTFVELRTSEGPRHLCFKHFQWVDQEQPGYAQT